MIFSIKYRTFGLALGLLCGVTFAVSRGAAESPRADHEDLSYYLNADGTRAPVRNADEWQRRRTQIIDGIQEVMGPLPNPKQPVPLDVQIVEEHQEDGYILRKLAYHTDDPNKRVRAWLLLPTDKSTERRPAVLCLQQTTPNGKNSP